MRHTHRIGCIAFSLAVVCAAAAAQPHWRLVARSGEPLGDATFDSFSYPTLSEFGRAGWEGRLQVPGGTTVTGLFGEGPSGRFAAMLQGEPAPGAPDGFTFAQNSAANRYPTIDNAGRLIWHTALANAANTKIDALYRNDAHGLPPTPIAVETMPAPEVEDGLTFSSLFLIAGNSSGLGVFDCKLAGAPTGSDSALYTSRPGQTGASLLVREGQQAPGFAPGQAFGELDTTFDRPLLNNAGQIAFQNTLSGVSSSSNYTIWRIDPDGAFTLMAREGNAVTNLPAGVTYTRALGMAMGNGGHVAFWADLNTSSTDDALLIADGATVRSIVREQDPAPGLTNAVFYRNTSYGFIDEFVVTARGQTAFEAYANGDGYGSSSTAGWWIEASPGQIDLIAAKGRQAPGLPEGVLIGGGDFRLSDNGQVLLRSILYGTDDYDGLDSLWLWDEGSLNLLLTEGDSLEVVPGDSRVVERFVLSDLFNANGQFALAVEFDDNSEALYVVSTGGVPPYADINGDGVVNFGDQVLLARAMGQTGADLPADVNGDGVVDALDQQWLKGTIGLRIDPMSTAPVPEPVTALLLAAALPALRRRRR